MEQSVLKKLARELSDYGADIISGLAIGVDAISHEASLLGKERLLVF